MTEPQASSVQVPPDRDAKALVEAIHAEAKYKPGTSMARWELSLARIEDHATRLKALLAERDAAAGDMLAALDRIGRLSRQGEPITSTHLQTAGRTLDDVIVWAREARDAAARSGAPRPDVLGALIELLAMVDQSEGVIGWHLNGATAPWSEFEFIEQLREAAQARGGEA